MSTDHLVDFSNPFWDSGYMSVMDVVEVPRSTEVDSGEFIEACNWGVEYLLKSVDQKYGPEGARPLDFHQKAHSEAVVKRTDTILATIQELRPELLTDKDRALARLAAAGHDIYQMGAPKDDNNKNTIRETLERLRGLNEEHSGEDVVGVMVKHTRDTGKRIFANADELVVREAILATVPGWDPHLGTVTQPNVDPGCSLVTFAVARADLGSAGMDGAEAFRRDGNNEFKETKLGISKAVKLARSSNPRYHKDLSELDKEYISGQIRSWLSLQVKFASGRQTLLDSELAVLGDKELEQVLKEKVFNKFDESIEDAKVRAERAQQMTFEDLIKEIGY